MLYVVSKKLKIQKMKKQEISIKKYLSRKGINPKSEKAYYGLYNSPFRQDETPSFKVDYQKNLWIDYGTCEGGSIVDLIMKMENSSLYEALLKAESMTADDFFSFHREDAFKSKEQHSNIDIVKIAPLENQALIGYLNERKIDLETARPFCKEIYYSVGGKRYFGIAFQNDLGGYEIRNKYFKNCTNKAISTIIRNPQMPIYVFEGFFDFLSMLQLAKQSVNGTVAHFNQSNFLILNSVSLVKQAITALKPYASIKLFLDNDDAGASSSQEIMHTFPQAENYSKFYHPHKDLNEYLMNADTASFNAFISRCAIVRTETKVSSHKGNLAFTPEGRKREETIPGRIVSKRDEPKEERTFKRRR